MRFAKENRAEKYAHHHTAEVLSSALPWIKAATGRTVVIKYGGSAMEDKALRSQVMSDIVLLKIIGMNPVVVHGGGKAINAAFKRLDIPVEFKNGLRVTTEEAMEVVKMVLVGQVNQELVRDMNRHGNLGVGVSGSDAGTVVATCKDPELGRVGKVTKVSTDLIEDLIENDYIPVIASVALGEDGGYFNINADVVASEIAAAVGAEKIIYLTDVDGLYLDFDDKDSLISQLSMEEGQDLIDREALSTGMIPKIQACIDALEKGVPRAHIINGTTPHAILLELLTDFGVGTMMYRTKEHQSHDLHPLSKIAAKLIENIQQPEKAEIQKIEQ